MSRGSAALGALAVVMAGAMACSAQAPEPTPPKVDDYGMTAYLDGLVVVKQFRGAVDVRRDGEVLLSRGFDLADVAGKMRNEPGTRFRIASLTKQITAMAVLVLQEQGKLRTAGDTLVYHHAGEVDGYATFSEIRPATGLSIVVFGNIQTADAAQITQNLAALARK